MARTTINIDGPVLRDLKRLQKRQGRSLGEIVSDLLSRALAEEALQEPARPFTWTSRPMRARVDLDDREAVQAVLDADGDRR